MSDTFRDLCAALTTIHRMPNVEHVADAHNHAVETLKRLADNGATLAESPKPPSLKKQSLALIDKIQGSKEAWDISDLNIIRRALEQLDD